MVNWLKRAEQCFAKEVHIVWLPAARPQTFVEWLGAARRARLEHVPPADVACDAQLAARMSKQEHYLLGYEPSTSMARPNAAAMELLRWLLLDKPRPQLAFCILQLKPILELGGDTAPSCPSWPSWPSRLQLANLLAAATAAHPRHVSRPTPPPSQAASPPSWPSQWEARAARCPARATCPTLL